MDIETLIIGAVALGVLYFIYSMLFGRGADQGVIRDRLTSHDDLKVDISPGKAGGALVQEEQHGGAWASTLLNAMLLGGLGNMFGNKMRCCGYMSPFAGHVFFIIFIACGFLGFTAVYFVPEDWWKWIDKEPSIQFNMIGGMIGLLIPYYIMIEMETKYKRRIELDMPFWLDLHCSLVEGGMGFDEAILLICSEGEFLDRPIFKELQQVLKLVAVGSTRADALLQMADRLKIDSMNAVVNAIIQGEQLGGGMVETLRGQAEMVRNKVWEEAQHKANKLPVALTFPMATGVLPAMFLITVGPPIIRLFGFMNNSAFNKMKPKTPEQ